MAIDGLILNKISSDLIDMLPARINKIHQISTFEVIFSLRMNGTNKNLIISCHSVYNRIHFTTKDYPTGNTPTQFILNLRRYLEGGTIYRIEQGGLDRYLVFEIAHRNEIKDKETLFLYIELMGKYANIILVNDEGKIIDALKKIPPFENNIRTIQRGATFTLPSKQDKINPFLEHNNDIESNFTATYHGFSPLLSKEIEYRINHEEIFSEIMQEIKNSKGIYIAKNDETVFHLIPLKHLNNEYNFFDIHNGLDLIYYLVEEKERIKQATGDLYKFVRRNLKQLNNKLPKLYDSYDDAVDCDKWKNYGDLLYTYQVSDTKGHTEVIVIDFEGNSIKIPLDSKLDIKQNAKKHYAKYQKGRKGQQHILEQIDKCKSEIEYFNSIEEQLEMANYDDASLIKQDLVNHGYIHVKTKPSNKTKKKEILLNTIEYKNQLIIFGKNNIQNDYLTFKVTKGNDTWFHAKDYHGAHVIVNNMNPDEDTIRLCANIAAYYSKGRLSSSVPVNYCLGKTLKKIPGSKLGLVQLSTYKTIYIDPDQKLIESLLIVKR